MRGASCRSLAHLVSATAKAEGVPAWAKGQPASSYVLGPSTREIAEKVAPLLVEHFELEDDRDTVAAASESLKELGELLGPTFALPMAPKLTKVALSLLQRQHPCMCDPEEEEEALLADEEGEDHDAALWEAVSLLLTSMPTVLGDQWLLHFNKLVPALLPYLGSAHPASDRSLAIGVLAESLHQLGGSGAPYFAQVFPIALKCAADTADVTVRQNGTFCLGVLGQYGGPAALQGMQQILSALQPRLEASEDESIRDNAIGALARLVLAYGDALPLPAIVPAIVNALPLKADEGENTPACRALFATAEREAASGGGGALRPHVGALLAACARLLTTDAKLASDELKAELRAFLKWLVESAPELRSQLPPELQQGLNGVLV